MSSNKNGEFYFGKDQDGNTYVFRKKNSHTIRKIFIEGSKQFANNDFASALYRLGRVNEIKNSDYQEAIKEIFVPN